MGPPRLPLTVVAGKEGGGNPGFFAKDARGKTFLIKFDTKENPELETAASVIVNRVFWTLGYNVPNDDVFVFARAELHLAPDAKLKDEYGRKRPMTEADVDRALSGLPRRPDGRYRASSSEFLKGIPKGGFPARGVRDDDPNDTVPHEHRREVRAVRVFAAWLNHSDMKEDNTLDMYVEENGRHFVRHYFLDFGEALGGARRGKTTPRGWLRALLGLGAATARPGVFGTVEAALGRRQRHSMAVHRPLRLRVFRSPDVARGISILALLRDGRCGCVLGRQARDAFRSPHSRGARGQRSAK